jgi:putative chitinase
MEALILLGSFIVLVILALLKRAKKSDSLSIDFDIGSLVNKKDTIGDYDLDKFVLQAFKKVASPKAAISPEKFMIYCRKYAYPKGINTKRKLTHFISQLAHESGRFKYIYELGGRKRFIRLYGRKKRLGNDTLEDGYTYRGRGFIQLTGKYNYRLYGKLIGLDLIKNPDLAAEPEVAVRIAVAYWIKHKLHELDDIETITRKINGGLNGIADRKKLFKEIESLI